MGTMLVQLEAGFGGNRNICMQAEGPHIIPRMTIAQRRTLEQMAPKYDAILGHVYWPTQKGRHTSVSLRTHIMGRAFALAYDNGRGADKIVVEGGFFWGPKFPAMGKMVADMLASTYHVPLDAIIQKEKAYSTYGEVKTVLELARENGWTQIMDVAFAAHHLTIPGIYKSKELQGIGPADLRVDCRSVESILERDDQRIVNVRRKFSTRYGFPHWAYEGLKWILMHRPGFKYEPLERANKELRIKPVNDFRYWRVDKFKLPNDDSWNKDPF
jgi:hypothetical protein